MHSETEFRFAKLYVLMVASMSLVGIPLSANAVQVKILARFTAEKGKISDAAILANGNIALLYPEEGRVACFRPDGTLEMHIIREAGEHKEFRPTVCTVDSRGYLLVYDEVDHQLFRITSDGNIGSGVNLAMPPAPGAAPLALARINSLFTDSESVWALLTDKLAVARFDAGGTLQTSVDLSDVGGFGSCLPIRAQAGSPGSLFFLDYNQGSILYRSDQESDFKRVSLLQGSGSEAWPWLQDFAVDREGRILLATADAAKPLMVLLPSQEGYRAHPLKLALPSGPQRLGVRFSAGKYILWTRDNPIVLLLELR